MATPISAAVDALRRPEYTGDDRCVPCTAVNVVVAALLAGAAGAAALPLGPAVAAALGAAVLLPSLGAIYLRGYLVPGTPWLTRTYFPDWLLRKFDKGAAIGGPTPADGDLDIEAFLTGAGAVTECERGDDLCLTDGFRAAWYDRIDRLRGEDTTREDLASVLEVDPGRLSFEGYGDAFVARLDGRRAGQWESRAAFLADVAAANALRERGGAWAALDVGTRSKVLNGLRIFLDRCPSCDGPVALEEEVVESCCRSMDVVAATCRDCGARVFEAERPG